MKPLTWSQVSAFRLSRNHLVDSDAADLTAVCRDVCGIQAQIMNAARTALWARMHSLKPGEVDRALNESRALIKTMSMRQTVHLLASDDFPIYVAALKRSRAGAILRIMARVDVTEADADRLRQVVLDALDREPMTQQELTARVKPAVSPRVRKWMELVWSPFRLQLVEGLICYGPDRGSQVTFVRVDRWLPRRRKVAEHEAKQILLRRYLGAYGPATLRDFCHWSGIPSKEAKPVWDTLGEEMVELSIEGHRASILRKDFKELRGAGFRQPVLRLAPGFDPYLLAHAQKDHLVSDKYYKRVYRNQGWISPAVLLNGRVIGIWSIARGKASAATRALEIESFEKLSRSTRDLIEAESASLGAFLQASLRVSFHAQKNVTP